MKNVVEKQQENSNRKAVLFFVAIVLTAVLIAIGFFARSNTKWSCNRKYCQMEF